ncbi:MAG: MATE family efflux transporter [Oscillospiraceae bacterium]|nr:MATE family efflux transporter [Oscillospiraceae bacterium]
MEENIEKPQNKMGTMPVPKLLVHMGIPMILSMLGQALYNFVDTYFVSQIPDTATVSEMGDKAINALTLAYPVQMVIIAICVGVGIATNSMLANNLGRKNREQASRVAGNAMFLCFLFLLMTVAFGLFAANAFIASQTDDPVVIELGTAYLQIVTVFSIGAIGYMCLEKVVMGCGNTRATMIGQLSGAVINIILDPILIFGLLGLPAMGVIGAAWATVIGQVASFVIICYVNFFRNHEIDTRLRYLLPQWSILKSMLPITGPAIIMQILTPVMSYGMNLVLGTVSAYFVTAWGVYYKVQYFMYMAIYGLNNASIAITAYNYGSRRGDRIAQSIRFALLYTVVMMVVGTVLVQLLANQLIGLFSITQTSAQMALYSLRIASLGFTIGGVNIILQGVCQALGSGVSSLIVSLLRQAAVILPLAYLFVHIAPESGLVWAALPIAELVGLIVAAILTRRRYRFCVKKIENPANG